LICIQDSNIAASIERFDDAWQRHVDVEGFPVCHPDDIIASKAAANRVTDRESRTESAGWPMRPAPGR